MLFNWLCLLFNCREPKNSPQSFGVIIAYLIQNQRKIFCCSYSPTWRFPKDGLCFLCNPYLPSSAHKETDYSLWQHFNFSVIARTLAAQGFWGFCDSITAMTAFFTPSVLLPRCPLNLVSLSQPSPGYHNLLMHHIVAAKHSIILVQSACSHATASGGNICYRPLWSAAKLCMATVEGHAPWKLNTHYMGAFWTLPCGSIML